MRHSMRRTGAAAVGTPRDVQVELMDEGGLVTFEYGARPTPPHPIRCGGLRRRGYPTCAVPPRLSSRSFGGLFLRYTLPRSAAVSTDRDDTAASNGVRHPHCFVFAVWFALVLTGTGRLDPMAPGTLGPN